MPPEHAAASGRNREQGGCDIASAVPQLHQYVLFLVIFLDMSVLSVRVVCSQKEQPGNDSSGLCTPFQALRGDTGYGDAPLQVRTASLLLTP